MYTEKLRCFSLPSHASWIQHRADSRGARLLVIHLYTAFPQPAVYIRRNSSSFPRPAASRYVAFSLRRGHHSIIAFASAFLYSSPTTSRWQICRNPENRWRIDGGISHGYPIVHSVYDNLDGKFAWKNVCCDLKSLYHASSRVYVTQFDFYSF